MKRVIAAIILILVSLSLYAKESYYSAIINASYLSDFAYNMLPVSLWGDFGVSGLDFFKGLDSKVYARLEAGLANRTVSQDPATGKILDDVEGNGYNVAFSDGSVVYEQGLLKDSGASFSLSFILRMRWEQAFADFSDIRNGNYAGVFGKTPLFPASDSGYLIGTPDLGGGKYMLSNSFNIKLSFNMLDDDYRTPEGFKVDASILFAPWFFLNKLSAFNYTKTSCSKMDFSAAYKHTFSSDKDWWSDRNKYSLYIATYLDASIFSGSAVPRYLMNNSFMGKRIPPRSVYMGLNSTLWLVGPEVLSKGTYPGAYVFFNNGFSAGRILNSDEGVGYDFLGGLGVGVDMHIFGLFRVFFEYQYVYTKIPGERTGSDFSFGGYLTVIL